MGAVRIIRIHPIMQAGVRASMNEHGRYEAFHETVCLLDDRWPSTEESTHTRKATCERLLPHVQRLYELYIEYESEWQYYMVDEEFPGLLDKVSRYVFRTNRVHMNNKRVPILTLGRYLMDIGHSHEGKIYRELASSIHSHTGIPLEAVNGDMFEFILALCDVANE